MRNFFVIIYFLFNCNLTAQDTCRLFQINYLNEFQDQEFSKESLNDFKCVLLGEKHGNDNDFVYNSVFTHLIVNGFNTALFEFPPSYYDDVSSLIKSNSFNETLCDKVVKHCRSKLEMKNFLRLLFEFNKKKELKFLMVDTELDPISGIQALNRLLERHRSELNGPFLIIDSIVTSYLSKWLYTSSSAGKYVGSIVKKYDEEILINNDGICLKDEYLLFCNIVNSMRYNKHVYKIKEANFFREAFMASCIINFKKIDSDAKFFGFFGSKHIQFNGDSIAEEHFVKNPMAKIVQGSDICKNVKTILVLNRNDKQFFLAYMNYLFEGDSKLATMKVNDLSKRFIYKVPNSLTKRAKLTNYSYIIFN